MPGKLPRSGAAHPVPYRRAQLRVSQLADSISERRGSATR